VAQGLWIFNIKGGAEGVKNKNKKIKNRRVPVHRWQL
jgi:hypothetical protein